MRGRAGRAAWVLAWAGFLVATIALPAHAGEPPQPDQARLRAIVEALASPEFGGRSGAGGEKTASYLIEQFRALKLEPLFDWRIRPADSRQRARHGPGTQRRGPLRGSDPKLRDEWVIVAAHFDHLGVRRGSSTRAQTTMPRASP